MYLEKREKRRRKKKKEKERKVEKGELNAKNEIWQKVDQRVKY